MVYPCVLPLLGPPWECAGNKMYKIPVLTPFIFRNLTVVGTRTVRGSTRGCGRWGDPKRVGEGFLEEAWPKHIRRMRGID